MDKQLLKRGSIVVASALTIFGLSVASPSMAATGKNNHHVSAASKKTATSTATPAPAAPGTGGNLSWGTGNGAGAGQGDDANEGPENHGQGEHGRGGDHGKRDHGKGPKGAPANLTDQTVTVDVPADSSNYVVVITEIAPAAQAPATGSVATPAFPARPPHVETVPVVGTGSQTVTFKGIAGQAYTVQLVKVVSVQSYTGK